jgi:hypothetical protein
MMVAALVMAAAGVCALTGTVAGLLAAAVFTRPGRSRVSETPSTDPRGDADG